MVGETSLFSSNDERLNADIATANMVLNDLIKISERVCLNHMYNATSSENVINDYFRDMLSSMGYNEVKDQTRHGVSGSGKDAAEVEEKNVTEKEFYELLIQVIRRDNYIRKNELLELLKSSDLSCDKTYQFTRNKWNHYQEYIYIKTTPANLINLMDHKTYLEKKIVSIYPVNDDYEWEFWGLEIKPGKVEANEYVNQEIYFEDIESQIIESIANAKYVIWIAMAWFTNRKLYAALIDKKKQGLNIQIVLDDNAKNHNTDFKLEDDFEVHWVKIQSMYTNIMHDKFCIIDLNKVIHGTFNWTNAANYNKETISIDENTVTARAFADEFMRLKLWEPSE